MSEYQLAIFYGAFLLLVFSLIIEAVLRRSIRKRAQTALNILSKHVENLKENYTNVFKPTLGNIDLALDRVAVTVAELNRIPTEQIKRDIETPVKWVTWNDVLEAHRKAIKKYILGGSQITIASLEAEGYVDLGARQVRIQTDVHRSARRIHFGSEEVGNYTYFLYEPPKRPAGQEAKFATINQDELVQ